MCLFLAFKDERLRFEVEVRDALGWWWCARFKVVVGVRLCRASSVIFSREKTER